MLMKFLVTHQYKAAFVHNQKTLLGGPGRSSAHPRAIGRSASGGKRIASSTAALSAIAAAIARRIL